MSSDQKNKISDIDFNKAVRKIAKLNMAVDKQKVIEGLKILRKIKK